MLRAILGATRPGFGKAFEDKTLQDKPGSGPSKKVPRKAGRVDDTQSAEEAELASRLRSLDERLDRKHETQAAAKVAEQSRNSGIGAALRMSTDFVAAVLVGAGLGFGLDWIFGTRPWGMIVFLLLGFCAGVLNVMRSAGKISDPHARHDPPGRPEMYDDEDK
jgi:ATP synthase protein I